MLDIHQQELPRLQRCWLTIGAFDGVHIGHQKMIRHLVEGARSAGQPAVAVTFHPHPQVTLQKITSPIYLTSPARRTDLLRGLGVDHVIILKFDKRLARQSAWEFTADIHANLNMTRLVVGPDFALGRDRGGSIVTLRDLGVEFGFTVDLVEPAIHDNEVVSSSRIRRLVAGGEIAQANRLLGREHRASGRVTQSGETKEFHFIPDEGCLLPACGDYPIRLAVSQAATGTMTIRPSTCQLWLDEQGRHAIKPDEEQEIIFL